MRYIVFGAGAVGCVVGTALEAAGRDVIYIARGEHLDSMRRSGLTIETPDGTDTRSVHCVDGYGEILPANDDVVVLSMKTQDTAAALASIVRHASPATPLVVAQNGVEAERLALRVSSEVVGAMVLTSTGFTDPGVIRIHRSPVWGIVDIGHAAAIQTPSESADRIAADLKSSGRLLSRTEHDVMAWKRAKLLRSVRSMIRTVSGKSPFSQEVSERAVTEASACFAAADLTVVDDASFESRHEQLPASRAVAGAPRVGSSSAQSLLRRTGSVEVDYVNGEISLLGRLYGVPTPVNRAVQVALHRMAAISAEPGSFPDAELEDIMTRMSRTDGTPV